MPVDETRPLGQPVLGFVPPPRPLPMTLRGRTVTIAPLRRADAPALFSAFRDADEMWDYMPIGPFASEGEVADWIAEAEGSEDPLFFTFSPEGEEAAGFGSYLRITPAAGSIEVGYLSFSPRLQRSVAATEAMFLMMKWAFEAGYRRYEWKCNALNAASRRAAERLGLSYEGVFRQAAVVKGRNRDTAWFAAIDAEWPALEAAFQTWLAPENFDADGRQKTSLRDLTAPILVARDPALI
jgi:RimJ/RimL family protein N-acetyltransferase